MKKHLFLYLLLVSSIIEGQKNDTSIVDIPRHAAIIYVKKVNFRTVVDELMKGGYAVDILVESVIVITKYKELPHSLFKIRFLIRYSDGTAQIMANMYDRLWSFRNKGVLKRVVTYEGYMFTEPFTLMNNFALSLNGIVSYEK